MTATRDEILRNVERVAAQHKDEFDASRIMVERDFRTGMTMLVFQNGTVDVFTQEELADSFQSTYRLMRDGFGTPADARRWLIFKRIYSDREIEKGVEAVEQADVLGRSLAL